MPGMPAEWRLIRDGATPFPPRDEGLREDNPSPFVRSAVGPSNASNTPDKPPSSTATVFLLRCKEEDDPNGGVIARSCSSEVPPFSEARRRIGPALLLGLLEVQVDGRIVVKPYSRLVASVVSND